MNRSPSRSQRPAALSDRDLALDRGSAAEEKPTGRTNAEKAAALLVVYGFVLLPEDRTFLESLLKPEAAIKLGAGANLQPIFDELVEALALFAPWIQGKRFTGYGPRRGRFAAECAHGAVGPIDAYHAAATTEKVASKEASHALALTAPTRQDALFAVQSLLPHGDVVARARLAAKTSVGTTRDAAITATAEVVREVEAVRANVPATMLDDAGLSPDTLDDLARRAQTAATKRTRYRDGRTARKALRSDLAALVGRMLFELRQLLAAARRARRRDASIPSFASNVVKGKPKTAKKPPSPTPVVTPPTP